MAGNVTPLEKPSKPFEQKDNLVTYDVSALWSGSGRDGVRYNPDDLVGRKGIDIYSKMLRDDQVKAATEFKLAAIMARGYEFSFEESSKLSKEQQQERIQICWGILDKMKGSFDSAIENVATGREFGFSVTEKVLSEVSIDGKMYTGISCMVLRDPSSFVFKADDYGQLTGIRQNVSAREVNVDPRKVVHYVHKPKWDEFYGRSELRACYDWWYIKQQVMRMWPMFLERYAGGFAEVRKTGDEAPNYGSAEHTQLENALRNIKALTSIVMPKGTELEMHFPTTTDAYEKCITFCDLAICRAQLVPNLLGISHTGQTGAFAQSQTQFEGFLWTVKQDGNALAECLNEQLFRPLFDLNFGDQEYPWFKFKPASFEHVKWMLTAWKDLLGAGAVVASEQDEAYIRKLLEMPGREPDEVLKNPLEEEHRAQDMQAQADALAAKQNSGSQFERAMTDRLDALAVSVAAQLNKQLAPNVTVNSPVTVTPAAATEKHHHSSFGLAQIMDRAAERVNFAVIEQRTDSMAATHVNELATIIAKATRRALGTEENMRQLMDNEPSDVIALDINAADRGKLRSACKELLNDAWNMGSNMASNEMDRARKSSTPEVMRVQKFTALRQNAVAYFDNQSFRMAGDASDQTRKIIQQSIQNGIKFGKPLAEVRTDIWNALVIKGLTARDIVRGIETDAAVNAALDALWIDTEQQATAYLNTVVRTNTFEAFNEARFAEFSDPELSDFVLALRYSAVMDSSTTPICRDLHDRVYKTDSDKWDTYRPPNHFNAIPKGTPIAAAAGQIPIEELKVGDQVLTHKGRYRQITETMHHDSWPEQIRIEFDNDHQFICTPDHPILTERGWVCAGDLQMTDVVMSFMRNGKTRYCESCKEKIGAKSKKKPKRFCGQKCMGESMRHVETRKCKTCNEPMVSTWKNPVSQERVFCSQSCYFAFKGETSIERIVREWLAESHIQAKPQYQFAKYVVDFLLPDFNMAVECDGDYWHTTKDKPVERKRARSALLAEFGVSVVRLTQKQIQSGEFKKILSEALHAHHETAANSLAHS